MERIDRERHAYDEDGVWQRSNRWQARFLHVFTSPNSVRHEALFDRLVADAARDARVLELGCGDGTNARRVLEGGARSVYGVEISETFLAQARATAIPGRLEFGNRDATQPFPTQYDLITGRSILHHLDYRPVLTRLYRETLSAQGSMIFMEPFGANPLIRAFTFLARGAHTPDERSLRRDDLDWLRARFPRVDIFPFNLASLPAGLVSSLLLPHADNWLLRSTDVIDRWVASTTHWFDPFFRHGILVIRKPGAVTRIAETDRP